MKKISILILATLFINISAMDTKKQTDEQKRENCRSLRIIRATALMNLMTLKEEADAGNIESQIALEEFRASCTNKRPVFMPPSRAKLGKFGLLDKDDRVHRSTCEAFDKEIVEECQAFDQKD